MAYKYLECEFSTSPNACVITFKGGPLDGESRLYDHARWDYIFAAAFTTMRDPVYLPTHDLEMALLYPPKRAVYRWGVR